MTDLQMRHFTTLRDRINQHLEELRAPHRREQIDKYTWLYGALGAVPSDVMFICENPSLRGVREAHHFTVDGEPPDIEAQWWGGPTGPPATRFRPALCELGLKTSPPSSKGGWRCYITNVIKEANFARDQARKERDIEQLFAQAEAWADILAWEMAIVNPRHVFAVGHRAYRAILELQARSALPRFTAHRILHFSARRRTDEEVKDELSSTIRSVIDPPISADARASRTIWGRIPERRFKYEHILDVILEARQGDTPSLLAERVRGRSPQGVYEPVRICEDINRILARQGVFNPANVTLNPEQRDHIIRLKSRMIADGAWQTR